MSRTVYSHPDGFTLAFKGNTLTANDDDGKTVSLPIGALGLLELGNALLALVAERDVFASERAGAVMGHDLLDELLALRGKPQSEAFRAVHDKLCALSKLEHFNSAAGGFAGMVVNVLEVGIANLPTFKGDEQ